MTWTVPDQGEPANDLQAVLFQSSLDALAAGAVLTGVITGCAVTAQGTPDMTTAVAAGTISLAGVDAAVTAGNVTIGAADATNPRLDLVVANGSGTKSVIAGTAAASPKEPTLDTTTYILLAQVYVPAAATTITTARITDRRVIVLDCTPVLPSPVSGRYIATGNGGVGANANPVTNTDISYAPFVIDRPVTLTSLSINVTTAVASNVPRLAVYADSAGVPGALVSDLGTVDGSTTGIKEVTCSLALRPGRYWGALYWGGVAGLNVRSTNSAAAGDVITVTTASAALTSASSNSAPGWYKQSAGSSMADPAPAVTGVANQVPRFALKIA